jgi:hypothetical protein
MPFVGNVGNSTRLGTGKVADAQTAALINGIASHADDYDDTHQFSSIGSPCCSGVESTCIGRGFWDSQQRYLYYQYINE